LWGFALGRKVGGFLFMNREKRSARLKVSTFPSIRQQLELFRAEEGSIVSMSDYLHQVIEDHIAYRSATRLRKPARRMGGQ
jgi:hypothetical protein